MHVVFRESHGLDEAARPADLGQDPADLVVLSFSDSDLGAFAAGWHRGQLPALRLANLAALRHPLSVDTYIERTLSGAKAILIRLIGGEAYWPYGLMQVHDLAKRKGIALAVLPGDGRPDARLDEVSTLPVSTLRRLAALCEAGGAVAAQAALAQLALAAGLYAAPVAGDKTVPAMGFHDPARGVVAEPAPGDRPAVPVVFYRAYLASGDTAPVDALIGALRARGFDAYGLFVPSLKAPGVAGWLAAHVDGRGLAAIVNATAFSAKGDEGASPLDAAGCPVFQVALSTARRQDWVDAARGLSPADLAMHVVLPEVDGRLFAGVISFKSAGARDEPLQFARSHHAADEERIAAVADRIARWHALAATPAAERRLAVILSTYPGRADQMAHAVGLDTLASVAALLDDLDAEGYDVSPAGDLAHDLVGDTEGWPLADYRAALAEQPAVLRDALDVAWGPAEDDAAVRDGAFRFRFVRRGKMVIALQPERGEVEARDSLYHDQSRVPRHGYVAFYLWLQRQGIHGLIHMGAHGTLEWLPGKAVALSAACWPEALAGGLPVVYPFIVNDPGEAAQAKRRIGALTLGHLPPPQIAGAVPEGLRRLERLLDEYSTADGLHPARRDRLIADIRQEARVSGVEEDLALSPDASPAEALTRLDRFVCDLKDSRFGDGLHVYGRGECGAAERAGLRSALAGRFVAPGPAGSPRRGRGDVLPTGRNLFAVDPRAVPSRAAHAQGVKLAEEVLRRHLQDRGEWPRDLVIDLWGSATMRTAGEEFAMALHLAGLAPRWDEGSGRISGFEVIPLALLARPRIGVTLRISGLFRDVFPDLVTLFGQGAAALAARAEPADQNPYATGGPRVFGPAPGRYGAGLGAAIEDYGADGRAAAGEAWLSASGFAFDGVGAARDGLAARVGAADGFVHVHDLGESDILLALDHAAHIGGFAAARETPVPLYHLDTTEPARPRARLLTEEIARITRARAASPAWAAGMMRHGFRGAAEIAATLDHMAAFAHLAGAVPAHLFDLYHDATLGRAEVADFMAAANPAALAALRDRFRRLHEAGLWRSRRNAIVAGLEGTS
ncbi:cobaltochelatase subunit CobN [Zavarzinia aquatilis]|uniref:Cobaltochelatase subunit CobN n=2 Tax=Zavarzinia aquatilis TaxID=2211142 RepID=A0A317DU40_9PROT|nr:cobaltochelatase subunit CobN [Zavarzinia aquatilis]